MRVSIGSFLAAFAVVAAPSSAFAEQPDVEETARRLYDEAVQAMDNKSYASACPKLEEVLRLTPGKVGAKITLAECYEESGRLASALAAYRRAEQAATEAQQKERAEKARQGAAALEPRCARLVVVVPTAMRGLPELVVKQDGIPVSPEDWGVSKPVDRGAHIVTVTAKERTRWETRVQIEQDGQRTSVEVKEPKPVPRLAGLSTLLPPATPDEAPSSFGAQRYAAVAVGASGLIAVGVGLGFGVKAWQMRDESNDGHCDEYGYCNGLGLGIRQEGIAAGNVSTALVLPGIAAIGASVVLFLTAPRPKRGQAGISYGTYGMAIHW